MRDICPVKINCNEKYSYLSSNISSNFDSLKTDMNENSCIANGDHKTQSEKTSAKCNSGNKSVSLMPKEMKSKYGVSYANKSIKFVKTHPLAKRKFATSTNHLTNDSAKVVLCERNEEIKDLESKVKYLERKIKELESENRTLQGVQSRQERELKKFNEGVADIPSLLRAHKEEIKVYQSTISGIRKELRDCQKEIKFRNEAILKKDSQIDKLNVMIKRYGKSVQDFSHEIKELKTAKQDLEEENKMLVGANQNLKFENDGLCKEMKDLCSEIENLEVTLSKEKDINIQLKIDIKKLQEKNVEIDKASGDKCILSEEHDTCNVGKEFERVSEVFLEGEGKKLENSLPNELDVKVPQSKQSGDKAKDALIHTLKCYQEFYDKNLNGFNSVVSSGIKGSKLKLLPPLKQPSRKHSQDLCIPNKEFSSFADGNKFFQCDKLSKVFQHKLKTDDFETNNPEDKTASCKDTMKNHKYNDYRELAKENNLSSEFEISWLDDL